MIPSSHKKTIISIVVTVLVVLGIIALIQKSKVVEVTPVETTTTEQLQAVSDIPGSEVPAGVTSNGTTMTTAPAETKVKTPAE